MSPELKQKAMLAKLSITQFSASKQDKTATDSVKEKFQTGNDAGRYQKALIARDAIKAVSSAANEARIFHYAQTLPWKDDGARILPAANYLQYSEGMRAKKATFQAAVQKFIASYPDLIEEAKTRLAGLFNASEYPDASSITDKYSFDVQIDPLPQAADFRVDLNSAEVEHIRKEIEARNNQAQAAATLDLWKRLNTAVSAMSERLNDPKAVFRDSLVSNIEEITEIIPRLNLTDDPALNRLTEEARTKLTANPPEKLRTDINTRKETAKAADELLVTMAAFMGA
jgi:hypothetical protein